MVAQARGAAGRETSPREARPPVATALEVPLAIRVNLADGPSRARGRRPRDHRGRRDRPSDPRRSAGARCRTDTFRSSAGRGPAGRGQDRRSRSPCSRCPRPLRSGPHGRVVHAELATEPDRRHRPGRQVVALEVSGLEDVLRDALPEHNRAVEGGRSDLARRIEPGGAGTGEVLNVAGVVRYPGGPLAAIGSRSGPLWLRLETGPVPSFAWVPSAVSTAQQIFLAERWMKMEWPLDAVVSGRWTQSSSGSSHPGWEPHPPSAPCSYGPPIPMRRAHPRSRPTPHSWGAARGVSSPRLRDAFRLTLPAP